MDYCIRKYEENVVLVKFPTVLDQYIKAYLSNIIYYAIPQFGNEEGILPYEEEVKYIFNLVEKFYLTINHLD